MRVLILLVSTIILVAAKPNPEPKAQPLPEPEAKAEPEAKPQFMGDNPWNPITSQVQPVQQYFPQSYPGYGGGYQPSYQPSYQQGFGGYYPQPPIYGGQPGFTGFTGGFEGQQPFGGQVWTKKSIRESIKQLEKMLSDMTEETENDEKRTQPNLN